MLKNLSVWISALALSGCALFLPETVVPLKATEQQLGTEQSDTLVIFLPGMGDSDESYFQNGFVDALNRHNKPVDVIAANTHFGYYKERSFDVRLKADVIEPAKAKGYKKIWLVGISLGGFGSLVYTLNYPDDVNGMIIMAPYLGDKKLIKSIAQYPTLAGWAKDNRDVDDDIAQGLWLPLAETDCLSNKPIYLAVGEGDKFIEANELLASRCPNIKVTKTQGGHNWKAWGALWEELLRTPAVL